MKVSLLLLLIFVPGICAAKSIQCERYMVVGGLKQDISVFSFTYRPEKASVLYTTISGPNLYIPTGSSLQPMWISKDGLRLVIKWKAPDYGTNEKRWSPVTVFDIDFAKPDYRKNAYGGFADFDNLLANPWLHECKRMD